MKTIAAFILLFNFSAQANSGLTCFTAVNPAAIQAQQEDQDVIHTGKSAELLISGASTGQMKILTDLNAEINILAFLNPAIESELPAFSVECDGGFMTVQQDRSDLVIANSNLIRGQIISDFEGCNNAKVQFKDLVFKQVTCQPGQDIEFGQ